MELPFAWVMSDMIRSTSGCVLNLNPREAGIILNILYMHLVQSQAGLATEKKSEK